MNMSKISQGEWFNPDNERIAKERDHIFNELGLDTVDGSERSVKGSESILREENMLLRQELLNLQRALHNNNSSSE